MKEEEKEIKVEEHVGSAIIVFAPVNFLLPGQHVLHHTGFHSMMGLETSEP